MIRSSALTSLLLALALTGCKAPDFEVQTLSPATVRQGGSTSFAIAVKRGERLKEAVQVQAADLPAGLSVPPVTLPAGTSEGRVTVTADRAAVVTGPSGHPVKLLLKAGKQSQAVKLTVNVTPPSGSRDRTFGQGGALPFAFGRPLRGDAMLNSVTDSRGRILLAGVQGGRPAVVRLTGAGQPDAAFGKDGRVTFGALERVVLRVTTDTKDRVLLIVAPRSLRGDMEVWRLTAAGAPDGTFGQGGRVALPAPSDAVLAARAIRTQKDGKVVVGGDHSRVDPKYGDLSWPSPFILRLNADGTLDTTFGTQGQRFPKVNDLGSVRVLRIQDDGRIVAAGQMYLRETPVRAQSPFSAFVARFLPDGQLDLTFGQGGVADSGRVVNPGSFTYGREGVTATGVALLPGGKILLAAEEVRYRDAPTITTIRLIRYLPDGRPDPAFGSGGTQRVKGTRNQAPSALVTVGADVYLSLVTEVDSAFGVNPELARLLPDGRPDPGFGTRGRADIGRLPASGGVHALPDGKLLVITTIRPDSFPAVGILPGMPEGNVELVRLYP